MLDKQVNYIELLPHNIIDVFATNNAIFRMPTGLPMCDPEQPDLGCLPCCAREFVPNPDIHESKSLR